MIVKLGCRDGAQEFQVLVWILGIPHLLDSQLVCGIMLFIFFLKSEVQTNCVARYCGQPPTAD